MEAVLGAVVDEVAPDIGHAAGAAVFSGQRDAVFVHFDYRVIEDERGVVY